MIGFLLIGMFLSVRILDPRTGDSRICNLDSPDWYAVSRGADVRIGSAEDCDVRLEADGVSPLHARFFMRDRAEAFLQALGGPVTLLAAPESRLRRWLRWANRFEPTVHHPPAEIALGTREKRTERSGRMLVSPSVRIGPFELEFAQHRGIRPA